MIVGPDLNLTLNSKELQGLVSRSNPLEDYFSQLVEDINLVDIDHIKVVPTWRNFKRGMLNTP